MKFTIKDVEKVAKLSRLNLNKKEQKDMVKELNDFLSYANMITELDLDNIEPISHVISVYNAFREDKVIPSMMREQLMDNAPDKAEGAFKVPKVIE